jgi:hypothetical protein
MAGLYPDLGDHNPVPVVSSSDIDQILYADSTHCPHLGLLMEASAAKLAGGWTGGGRLGARNRLYQPQLAWNSNPPD